MKETVSKLKRQPSEWEKIRANEAADKELISKLYNQLLQLKSRKINDPIKKWAKELNRHIKKTYRWLTNTWKDAQHHSLSEKCKSKPQWGTISRWSKWLLSKSIQTIKAGEGAEKGEPSYTVGGNANYYSHYGEQCRDSLKILEIELPYDPAIPLLGIQSEETRIERDTCTSVFIAALFIIARTWKQPRCPSADEWIRKLWYRVWRKGNPLTLLVGMQTSTATMENSVEIP